jgi:hypothetical protein
VHIFFFQNLLYIINQFQCNHIKLEDGKQKNKIKDHHEVVAIRKNKDQRRREQLPVVSRQLAVSSRQTVNSPSTFSFLLAAVTSRAGFARDEDESHPWLSQPATKIQSKKYKVQNNLGVRVLQSAFCLLRHAPCALQVLPLAFCLLPFALCLYSVFPANLRLA